jgi:hypothetical protein
VGTAVVASLCAGATAASASPAPARSITLRSSVRGALSGDAVRLTGRTTGLPARTKIDLYRSRYPYTPPERLIATTTTGSAGGFSFAVDLDRTTRYRVIVAGTNVKDSVLVLATGRTTVTVKSLALGRAGVSILVYHPRDLLWGDATVRWSFASGHGGFIHPPVTRTERLSPYVIKLSTTITLPAGPFRWRACFHAPLDQALLNSRRPPGCTGRGYHGGGALPVGYPGPSSVARAASYLARRTGRTAFAVMDSEGRLSGVHIHWTFVSASVVKAMLLVAYLRRLAAMGQHYVDAYSNSFLYPMINVSDNSAATQTWSIVGDAGLYAVASAAGMTDFSIVGIWANAQISAADQARFFFYMDEMIPPEFVGYARRLLSTIAAYESWGIPAVARPQGYQVFFKGGWRGTALGQLVHQVARLEGRGRTFSIAVMTDGDPSMGYGIDTIQGVAGALL